MVYNLCKVIMKFFSKRICFVVVCLFVCIEKTPKPLNRFEIFLLNIRAKTGRDAKDKIFFDFCVNNKQQC